MDTSDWVTAVIAVAALGVAVWSYLGARKQAERSADAAEESLKLQRAQADRYTPHWDAKWLRGSRHTSRYAVTNRCGERCEGVNVTSEHPLFVSAVPTELGDGESGEFSLTEANVRASRILTIEWHRPGSEEMLSFRCAIPPAGG